MTHSDDLGRVVVPKEIRRTLGIREGTPLEIFTGQDGEVILKEVFSAWRNIYICEELCRESGAGIGNAFLHYGYGKGDCCFRNREKGCSRTGGIRGVCLSSGRTESGIHKSQRGIRYRIPERKMVDYGEIFVCPVLAGGDVIGSVLFVRPEREKGISEEICQKLAQCAAAFLGSQMET